MARSRKSSVARELAKHGFHYEPQLGGGLEGYIKNLPKLGDAYIQISQGDEAGDITGDAPESLDDWVVVMWYDDGDDIPSADAEGRLRDIIKTYKGRGFSAIPVGATGGVLNPHEHPGVKHPTPAGMPVHPTNAIRVRLNQRGRELFDSFDEFFLSLFGMWYRGYFRPYVTGTCQQFIRVQEVKDMPTKGGLRLKDVASVRSGVKPEQLEVGDVLLLRVGQREGCGRPYIVVNTDPLETRGIGFRGGRAAGRRAADFDPVQLRRGTLVEMEHTASPQIAQRIAMDHLAEHPDYYIELAKMHATLRERRRAGNPAHWSRIPAHYSNRRWLVLTTKGVGGMEELGGSDYTEFYSGLGTRVSLEAPWIRHDIDPDDLDEALASEDAWFVVRVHDPFNDRWYRVTTKDDFESFENFYDRDEALARAAYIARDIRDARVGRLPDWKRDDLTQYLTWFKNQVPNRVDYVRLFWANDRNGAYDGLLAENVRESEETFDEVFGEYLPQPAGNPAAPRIRLLDYT